MRLRIILLAVAISSMILVSFLVPLALLLRTFQADRAVSAAAIPAAKTVPETGRPWPARAQTRWRETV